MWEQRYGIAEYVYGTEPNEFLREHLAVLPHGRVLCVAEGEGRNSVFIAASGREVHGVDLTDAGVEKTRRLAAERNVQVNAVVADLTDHDIGVEQWDAVVSIFAHMPPSVRRSLHQRVVAALRPGGVLLLEAYTPDQIGRGTGGPAVPEMTMTLEGLRAELQGLVFEHGIEVLRDVVEGPGHTGLGAVVQVIARKPD
jgi:2-polyprenyl-3-methyl-5-hydroxy-6-metoxy-1,4-benzoquinol methylase